jgi:hypothetical protein
VGDALIESTDTAVRRVRIRSDWALVGFVCLVWLLTRLGYVLVSYVSGTLHLYQVAPGHHGLISPWQQWDVNWYLIISRQGYVGPAATAFFPLYPATIGVLSWLLGDGSGPLYPQPDHVRLLVGMALSNLALLASLYGLARLALVERPSDADGGRNSALAALSYPIAIAWTVAYAEGYFLAFAVFTMLFARKRRWYAATAAAFLLGLTRPVAVIVVLPLLWEYGRQKDWWTHPGWRGWRALPSAGRGLLAAAAAPLGTAVYLGYCRWRFGDFLLPLHMQSANWLRVTRPQWWTLDEALHRVVLHNNTSNMLGLELGLLVVFCAITLVSIRRVPFAYTLYSAGLLFVATASPVPSQGDLLWGVGRYLGEAFPVFLIVGWWGTRYRWLLPSLSGAGFLLQGTLAVAWFQGQPIL